jgi:hypothetical protein
LPVLRTTVASLPHMTLQAVFHRPISLSERLPLAITVCKLSCSFLSLPSQFRMCATTSEYTRSKTESHYNAGWVPLPASTPAQRPAGRPAFGTWKTGSLSNNFNGEDTTLQYNKKEGLKSIMIKYKVVLQVGNLSCRYFVTL